VFVLLLCESLRRGEIEILQKASLNTKQSKPYAKSDVKKFIGEKFNLEMFALRFLIQTER